MCLNAEGNHFEGDNTDRHKFVILHPQSGNFLFTPRTLRDPPEDSNFLGHGRAKSKFHIEVIKLYNMIINEKK